MLTPEILTFISIVTLLTITPGADTMLVLCSVLAQGRSAGFLTTIGITLGLFVHAALSAIGLSVILVQSALAFNIVRWIGAGYLIFLGLQSLRQLRYSLQDAHAENAPTPTSTQLSKWQPLLNGLLTNIFNPKVAIFYLAFLPQFITSGESILGKSLLLAGIHGVLGIVWLSLITVLISRFRTFLTNPTIRRRLEAVTGVVLIGFGIRLAVE